MQSLHGIVADLKRSHGKGQKQKKILQPVEECELKTSLSWWIKTASLHCKLTTMRKSSEKLHLKKFVMDHCVLMQGENAGKHN